MNKKERQRILAEIAEVKDFQNQIDKKMDRYIDELKKFNLKLDAISDKFDVILKWSKYASQLWDRN